jgi:hypothetical protein
METDNIKRFNKYAKEFFKELNKMFPDDAVTKIALQSFNILKSMNKKMPCEYFFDNVVKLYEQDILDKIPFFVSDTFDIPITFPIILTKLKEVWQVLDAKSKIALWDHITVLLVLCKKCQPVIQP